MKISAKEKTITCKVKASANMPVFLFYTERRSFMARSKYEYWLTEEGLIVLGGLARDGLTDQQIADSIGISRSTLSAWKLKYPDISDTLKNNKDIVDRRVENALLENALGAYQRETVEELIKDPKTGEKKLTLVKRTEKQYPGNTLAQMFWLKNRKPKDWRDKPEVTNEETLEKLDEILKGIDDAAKR